MQQTESKFWKSKRKPIALVCGALGVLAAVWAYWMVLPGVILGAVAVVLGWLARRDGHREPGSVAMTLGIVAILLVPSVLVIANQAEKWGRDCALDPTHDPNC
jgi:predicted PurR-regulated permease PerM